MSATKQHEGVGSFLGALDVTIDLPLASVGSRGLAHLLDMLVAALGALILLGTVALIFGSAPDSETWLLVTILVIGFFLLQWTIFAVFEIAMDGQSLGKRLMRLRVVADDGSRASLGALLLRNLARPVDMFPGTYGIGVPIMALHPRSKRLGDLIAGTVVVREGGLDKAPLAVEWPDCLENEEIVILESFFSRTDVLLPERRESIAYRLIQWLERAHPELGASPVRGLSYTESLLRLFHVIH